MTESVFTSPVTGESYTRAVLDNGVRVLCYPKRRSSSTAVLGVGAGSLDDRRVIDGREVRFPDGIAHFLEHKLFENPDGTDAFDSFSRYGAVSNAFTSFCKTAYHFSATRSFSKCLSILIDFVLHPYFTPESVEKERGIIAQEIAAENDNPSTKCLRGLLSALYKTNPVRLDIAGDAGSIKKITPETLSLFYQTFYAPDKLILAVSGKARYKNAIELASAIPPAVSRPSSPAAPLPEPEGACRKKATGHADVAKPLFSIGVKDPRTDLSPSELLKKNIATSILCEILFSKSSPFFNSLYDDGLISNRFSFNYTVNRSFGLFDMSGDSHDPEAVLDAFSRALKNARKNGISDSDFERCKRLFIADAIRDCDSTEDIAMELFSSEVESVGLFDAVSFLSAVKKEDLYPSLDLLSFSGGTAISVISPFPR